MKGATRFFDIVFSFAGIILLLPFFIFIAAVIKLSSKGPAFFLQKRVGKNNTDFVLYKFRTMKINAQESSLTIGNDKRITPAGRLLRKFKIDELPQLWNVLKGEMSLVGPRPELRKYVDYYTEEQKIVLTVRPGITDYASIEFRNENNLLAKAADPENFYINEILPIKISLNRKYILQQNLSKYFSIIFNTVLEIFTKAKS